MLETKNLIDNLKNTNSAGYDDIQTNILKKCKNEIAGCIQDIINTSIKQGHMPSFLKISKVVPI